MSHHGVRGASQRQVSRAARGRGRSAANAVVAVGVGAEIRRSGRNGLVGIGADLKSGASEGAIQQLATVELGGFGDAVQLGGELVHFGVQRLAVRGRIGGVGRLHRQLPNTLQDVAGTAQSPFSHLRQRNAVIGIARGLVHAANLRGEALRNGQASGVIFGAVDAQTR
ncbi:hypothetical protein D3C71_1513730 [compost metagenome]